MRKSNVLSFIGGIIFYCILEKISEERGDEIIEFLRKKVNEIANIKDVIIVDTVAKDINEGVNNNG